MASFTGPGHRRLKPRRPYREPPPGVTLVEKLVCHGRHKCKKPWKGGAAACGLHLRPRHGVGVDSGVAELELGPGSFLPVPQSAGFEAHSS